MLMPYFPSDFHIRRAVRIIGSRLFIRLRLLRIGRLRRLFGCWRSCGVSRKSRLIGLSSMIWIWWPYALLCKCWNVSPLGSPKSPCARVGKPQDRQITSRIQRFVISTRHPRISLMQIGCCRPVLLGKIVVAHGVVSSRSFFVGFP